MALSSNPIPRPSPGLIQRLADHWKADPSSRHGTGTIARLFAKMRNATTKPTPRPAPVAVDADLAALERQFATLTNERDREAFVSALANQIRAASKPKQQATVRRAQFAVMPAKAQATFLRGGGRIVD